MKPAWCICVFAVLGRLGTGPAAEPQLSTPSVSDETVQQAQRSFLRGNYPAAAGIYENLLAKAPDDFKALTGLGIASFRLEQLGGAADVLERAAKTGTR